MFKKTVKKTCVQPGCPNKDQAVDLGLNVCEFDGTPLVEEKALDRKAAAFAAAAGVLLMAVAGYGATIMVKRWLMTKATSAIVAQLGDVYDSSFGEQLRARAAGLVQIRGSDEETTRRIVQELHDVAPKQSLTVTESGVAIVPRVADLVLGSNHVFAAKATFPGRRAERGEGGV